MRSVVELWKLKKDEAGELNQLVSNLHLLTFKIPYICHSYICHSLYLSQLIFTTAYICHSSYLSQLIFVTAHICHSSYLSQIIFVTAYICHSFYLSQLIFVTSATHGIGVHAFFKLVYNFPQGLFCVNTSFQIQNTIQYWFKLFFVRQFCRKFTHILGYNFET